MLTSSLPSALLIWLLASDVSAQEQRGAEPLPSGTQNLQAVQTKVRAVVSAVGPATVAVGGATGILISADGYIATAGHVAKVAGRKVRVILNDGREVAGTTCGISWDDDAALVKLVDDGPWPFAPVAPAGEIGLGDWCVGIGHPGGLRLGRGLVTRLGRVLVNTERNIGADIACSAGDSGGPLLDLEGRVIGLASAALMVAPMVRNSGSYGLRYAPAHAIHRHWDRLVEGETWGKINSWPHNNRIRTADLRSHATIRSALAPVASSARRSVVQVRCAGRAVSLGTVVGADGWILTRHSALTPPVEVVLDSSHHPARIAGVRTDCDLAMLKINVSGLTAIPLTTDKAMQPGDCVVAVGTAATPLAMGVVGVAARDQRADRDFVFSGSVPFRSNPRWLRTANSFTTDGIVIRELTAPDATNLRVGDLILKVGDTRVPNSNLFHAALADYRPEATVTFLVERAGEEITATARLGNPRQRVGRYAMVLQHDAQIVSNQSGGPLVALDGSCVGINVASSDRQYFYENYAVPTDLLRRLVPELMR